jgi:hypothetical protein
MNDPMKLPDGQSIPSAISPAVLWESFLKIRDICLDAHQEPQLFPGKWSKFVQRLPSIWNAPPKLD